MQILRNLALLLITGIHAEIMLKKELNNVIMELKMARYARLLMEVHALTAHQPALV